MITVRRATSDDLESTVAAYTAAWRDGFAEMFTMATFMRDDFLPNRHDEVRDVLRDDSVLTSVVEVDGHVMGFSSISDLDELPCLDDLWVHPHAWGTGAAPALLADAEDSQRSSGKRRLTTWVPEDSPRARGLVEKAGWTATGSIEAFGLYEDQPNRLFEYERVLN